MAFIFLHFALTTPLLYRQQSQDKGRKDLAMVYADFEESIKAEQPLVQPPHIPRPPGARLIRAQNSYINHVPLEACALETRLPPRRVLDFYFNYFAPRGWQDITRESMKMRLNPAEYRDWHAMQDEKYVNKYQQTMATSLVMKSHKASIHITITQQGRPVKNMVSIRWFGTPDMDALIPRTFVGRENGEEPAMVLQDPLQNGDERISRFYRSRAEPQAYFDRLSKKFIKDGYSIMFENVPADVPNVGAEPGEQSIFAYFTHPVEGRFLLVVTRDTSDRDFAAGLFLKM
jgi:hypothetical protein